MELPGNFCCLAARFRPRGAGTHNYMSADAFTSSVGIFFYMPLPARCRSTTSRVFAQKAHDKFVLRLLTTRQKCRILFPGLRPALVSRTGGEPVIRTEPLYVLSPPECCVCERTLSVRELEEFYAMADETLGGDIHCPSCAVHFLTLCRECSCRYTADRSGICEECQRHDYAHILSS
jgi:hypothetical protein